MKNHIEITEEDIFRFVHSQGSLPKDKFEYLSNNSERFTDEIEMCKEAIHNINSNAESISKVIIEQINNSQLIELIPTFDPDIEKGIKLAASSARQIKPCYPLSFKSNDEKYLIRIVETKSQYFLYIFTQEKILHDLKIKFYPSLNTYVIGNITEPIEIINEEVIERVTIEK